MASRPSPKMGMVPRHTSSGYHSNLSASVQPLVGPCVSTGGSALRTSVQAFCGYNRCFQDWLGCCVQRACSLGYLEGPLSAMAHQLPRVAICALSLEEASAIDSSPPSPLLESAACEIVARRSHPGHLYRAAKALSRQVTFHGEWRLHPIQLIWNCFGEAQIDLFASHELTHCTLWYSLTEAPLGTDALAQICVSPNLVHGPHAASVSPFLANSPEQGPSFSGAGHNLASAPRSLESPRLVPGRDEVEFRDLSPAVISFYETALCSEQGLEKRLSASTLKDYVAAVAANHDLVDGRSLGKHNLIIRLLRGARRINPPRPRLIPSWDLSVVLLVLQREPFEPLQSVKLGALSMKTALQIALTFLKRVRDLQALSVCNECLEFGPAYSHIVLKPQPAYVPKVPTTPFRDQVVNLQPFALSIYLERTQSFRQYEQLFVCFGGR
ncbi:hypothetical protein H4Q32_016682 [Labeo rohita]|uniref:Uncharacterized protein n=1 Tax=Labeo rohita TaxID=84645 RepID=A0ABQ8M6R7_LABRO|nr:hypothetical protein H4Q32_016682 [Labeo rohita]